MTTSIKAIETTYKGYRFRSRKEARWAVFFDNLGIKYEYEREGYDLNGTWYLPDFWLPEHECFIEVKGEKPTNEEREKADLLHIYTSKAVYIFHGDVWLPSETTGYAIGSRFSLYGRSRKIYEREEDWVKKECEIQAPPRIMSIFYAMNKQSTFPKISYSLGNVELIVPTEIPVNTLINIHKLIRQHRNELASVISCKNDFEWSLKSYGASCGTDLESAYYWCECLGCKKYIIERSNVYSECDCGEMERSHETPSLIAAYTAARQARF